MYISPVTMTNQYRTNRSNFRKENVSNVSLNNQSPLNFKATPELVAEISEKASQAIKSAQAQGKLDIVDKIMTEILPQISTKKFSDKKANERLAILTEIAATLGLTSEADTITNKPEEESTNVKSEKENKNYLLSKKCLFSYQRGEFASGAEDVARANSDLRELLGHPHREKTFPSLLKDLLDKGADVNIKADDKRCNMTSAHALMLYYPEQQDLIRDCFTEHELDPSFILMAYPERYANANYLHSQTEFGIDDSDTIKVLAESGVPINGLDVNLRTPLDIAIQHGKTKSEEVLRSLGAKESAELLAPKTVRNLLEMTRMIQYENICEGDNIHGDTGRKLSQILSDLGMSSDYRKFLCPHYEAWCQWPGAFGAIATAKYFFIREFSKKNI